MARVGLGVVEMGGVGSWLGIGEGCSVLAVVQCTRPSGQVRPTQVPTWWSLQHRNIHLIETVQ